MQVVKRMNKTNRVRTRPEEDQIKAAEGGKKGEGRWKKKEVRYGKHARKWTRSNGVSCRLATLQLDHIHFFDRKRIFERLSVS